MVGILLILLFVPLGKADLSLGNYVISLILQANQAQDPFTISNATGSTLLKIDANSTLTINDASGNPSTVVGPRSGVEPASYIIFTDGTNVYAKNGTTGKVEFNGNATDVIQNAINSVNLSGGGSIFLKRGNYTINPQQDAYVVGWKAAVKLENMTNIDISGDGAAIITFPNEVGSGLSGIIGFYLFNAKNVKIHDIIFDGNKNGINSTIPYASVLFFYNPGASTSNNNIWITDNYFKNTVRAIYGDGTESTNGVHINRNIFDSDKSYPISLHNSLSYSEIVDNIIQNSDIGMFIDTIREVVVSNNIIYNSKSGGILIYDSVYDTLVNGNIIIGNQSGASMSSTWAIKLYSDSTSPHQNVERNVITNNIIRSYPNGIYVSWANDTLIENNYLSNIFNITIFDSGINSSNSIIRSNVGYRTENKGTTLASNGNIITHGLVATPIFWTIFPQAVNVTASATETPLT